MLEKGWIKIRSWLWLLIARMDKVFTSSQTVRKSERDQLVNFMEASFLDSDYRIPLNDITDQKLIYRRLSSSLEDKLVLEMVYRGLFTKEEFIRYQVYKGGVPDFEQMFNTPQEVTSLPRKEDVSGEHLYQRVVEFYQSGEWREPFEGNEGIEKQWKFDSPMPRSVPLRGSKAREQQSALKKKN